MSSEQSTKNEYPLEMKAYAKMLYLCLDEDKGKRQYSHQNIIDMLQERFGDSPSKSGFRLWTLEWQEELELLESKAVNNSFNSLGYVVNSKSIERVESHTTAKAIVDHLKMSLIFHSNRMKKYGLLEERIVESLLAGQIPEEKVELINKLIAKHPEVEGLTNVLRNFKLVDIQRGVTDSNKVFIEHLEKLEKWLALSKEIESNNIIEMKQDDIWEYEPVDIEEFLESDEFLGSIYDGLYKCVVNDIKTIFYGNPRKLLERRKYKEVVFKEAYGSGKSSRAGLISLYITYLILCLRNPAKYFKLLPGSKITVTNVSVTKKQAYDVVFGKAKSFLGQCPWFKEHGYMPDPRCKTELRFDPSDSTKIESRIYKNVYITPGSSSEFSAVGYDVICGIIDEATAFGVEHDEDRAEVIYNTLLGRIASRFKDTGLIIMAGNPHHVDDFLERRLQDVQGRKDVYVVKQRSVWDAKIPDYEGDHFYFDYSSMKFVDEVEYGKEKVLKIPIIYKEEFESKPEISVRNLAGISLESITRFISNVDKIDEMFQVSGRKNPVEVLEDGSVKFDKDFKPVNKGVHAVHVDIGVTGDALGIALGHISGMEKGNPIFYIDCVIRLKGSTTNPNILEDVRSIIYQLSKLGFNIGPVSLDGYQSTDFVQIMNRRGYDSFILSVDKKTGPYINLRQALYEGRINCPFDDFLRYELRTLENVNDKKIDHPFKGSKDSADAVCGVINSLIDKVPIEAITSDIRHTETKEVSPDEESKKIRTPEECFEDLLRNMEEDTHYGNTC